LDGAAYWEEGTESWCEELETTLEDELGRYDAVMFFQSAAVSKSNLAINGTMLEGGNAARTESHEGARILDEKLYNVWKQHPKFYLIKSQDSFFAKITEAVHTFRDIIDELEELRTPHANKKE
jgi:hypothetical protein